MGSILEIDYCSITIVGNAEQAANKANNSQMGRGRSLGPKVNRALLGVPAIALAGFGMYQLWLGLGNGRAG